jgi:AraC-like DNA-binding protein
MDPLSAVLDVFELTLTSSTRFEASGPWALGFDRHDHLKVGAVLSGACWIQTSGGATERLTAGDSWLLVGGPGFTVSSDLDVDPLPQVDALPSPWASTVHYAPSPETADGPHQRTVLVSSSLSLNSDATELLLSALPPLTRISAADPDAPAIAPILELLNGESAVDLPGGTAMRRHLAHVLFLHTLRFVHRTGQGAHSRGWWTALADPLIGRSLRAVHSDPARKWTVADLADEARMSRSLFAERFHQEVGVPPAQYAARWRVHVVAHQLRTGDQRIAEIATELGFSSPSALSAAFTRHAGCSPAQYRTEHRAVARGL